MASAFSHALAAVAIGRALTIRESLKFWLLGMFCAVIPDADVVAFSFGIPYDHPFGHRGFTHSLFFAVILGALITLVFYKNVPLRSRRFAVLSGYFFLATASHSVLDAFTNGGLGVAFFYPFTDARYFFPWRPIQVSPISVDSFFSEWGIRVLKSELIWIGIPSVAVIVVSFFRSSGKKENAQQVR